MKTVLIRIVTFMLLISGIVFITLIYPVITAVDILMKRKKAYG